MAYVASLLTTTASGNSFTPVIPAAYAANDLLLCLLESGGTTSVSTSSTGWAIHSQQLSGNTRMAVAWKVAGASEANPSFSGANATWHGTMMVIRDAPSSSPINGVTLSAFSAVNTANSGALNTGSDNGCLLIYATGLFQGYSRYSSNDVVELDKAYETNSQLSLTCGYRLQVSGGACPTLASYFDTATRTGVTAVIAIKNAGTLTPDCRDDSTPIKWYGNFGTQAHPVASWVAANNFVDPSDTGVQIGPLNLLIDTATATQNNNVGIPGHWGSFTRLTTNSTIPDPGEFAGAAHAITSTDFTGKIFSIQMELQNLSDSIFGTEGLVIAFCDGSNWAAYQVAQRNKLAAGVVNTYHIDLATATKYDESASPLNIAAVTSISYWHHRRGNSASPTGVDIKNACLLGTAKITGGGANYPASFKVASQCLEGWGNYRTMPRQAAGQFMAKCNIQIGDGTIATYFKLPPQSFSYPETYTPNIQPYQYYWNCGVGAVKLSVYASSADTIKLISGVASTSTDENFEINAASSASAAYDFSGLALVGYTPTWNSGVTCNGVSFTACDTVAFKGADVTGCTVTDTFSTNAACSFDANGAVVASTTIAATSATGYHIELGAAVTAITLTDVTFSGTALTNKVHVLATTGTVTITIGGTTALTAGQVTSAGAAISVVAPSPTLSATVLANSRVVLYNATTSAELDNVFVTGTAWSKVITSGASNGDTLRLYVFKEGYAEYSTSFLYSGADATILVAQVTDPVISAFRTEDSITDYTTLTEFNMYAPTIYIRANDVDGVSKVSRLAIYYNGLLTTADGARYFRGGMSMISTGAVRINKSAVSLLVENVSTTLSFRFSDELTRRLYTDNGTSWIAPSSEPGSIEYAYGGVPDVITTSDQSLNLATAETAIENKKAAIASQVLATTVEGSTTVKHSLMRSNAIISGKVSGAGSGTEIFRDIADTKDRVVITTDANANRTAVVFDGT